MAVWSSWALSGSGVPPCGLAGGVAAASWGVGRVDLVARGNDQQMWHVGWAQATGWGSPWDPLGGVLTANPALSSWASGRLDAVVRGLSGALYHKFYVSPGPWSAWESLGGQLMDSNPALTTWGVNRLDVFAIGTGSNMFHKWFDGTWHDWENLGGLTVGDPGAAGSGGNRIDLFVINNLGNLAHKFYTPGTGWSGFLTTTVTGPWTIGLGADFRTPFLDIFGITPAGTLEHAFTQDGGATFGYELLDGTLVSAPAAVCQGNGTINLYAVGTDGMLYTKSFS